MRKNRREKGVLNEILSSFSLNKRLIVARICSYTLRCQLSYLFMFVGNFHGFSKYMTIHCSNHRITFNLSVAVYFCVHTVDLMKDLPENPQKNYEPTRYAVSQLRPLYSPKSSCRISAPCRFSL
jgi:hypothetical protein